ncbi:hypothetical protein [Cohnella silvisoli]|uniref:Uncharacterized protein n=1 Tax=Cohnella silvisoli TaxID=2873699 RepID=A0ABV1KSS3_9BACL|nr:hypothetical protein [Cohnella silvisoli]MCD9021290.1 hypothetical protein [Cohnella silvisoli]
MIRIRVSDGVAWSAVDIPFLEEGLFETSFWDNGKIKVEGKRLPARGSGETLELTVNMTFEQETDFYGLQLDWPIDRSLRCAWKPHLCPDEDMVIGDKVFRSPVVIVENATEMKAFIPDLNGIAATRPIPHLMDYVQTEHRFTYGLCHYKESDHVYHRLDPKLYRIQGEIGFKLFIVTWKKNAPEPYRDFRKVEQMLWELYGERNLTNLDAKDTLASMLPYMEHTYHWAFESWKDVCWQEFKLLGATVGGVAFLVTAGQKPGQGRENVWREPKSIWNQLWFCSLRSAYGYALWGRHLERRDWMEKAEKALNFALSAPQRNGLFPAVYEAGADQSWENGRWHWSAPRKPAGLDDYVHLADSSWTCYWLLKWYLDVDRDPRILPYVHKYVFRLLELQFDNGSFPAWVSPQTFSSAPYLIQSPENAVHAMLLCKLYELELSASYLAAAERAMAFVRERVIPIGRWEDFETYWSCSREWEGKAYGQPDPRSGLYNQNNLGIYWTAEAMKELYRLTGKESYLLEGEQVLAELSLYQQIWQPPFFEIGTIGGFGVMNSDDEWNDARQSLFALTYWDYYVMTGNESYKRRSLWAMKASFYMMYCPENPVVKRKYESVHGHFDHRDYGFNMENFNHHDGTSIDGIGEFTIFDWGNGAASASLIELYRK